MLMFICAYLRAAVDLVLNVWILFFFAYFFLPLRILSVCVQRLRVVWIVARQFIPCTFPTVFKEHC